MVKKIGKDTVVVMTLKQGNEVNQKFVELQDSITLYKKTIDTINYKFKESQIRSGMRLQRMYESYWQEYENGKISSAKADSFRHMYMANKIIYLENEKRLTSNVRHITVFSTVLALMVMFFASI